MPILYLSTVSNTTFSLLYLSIKSTVYFGKPVLVGLWVVGIVVGWLALWHFIPMRYVWFGVLMYPLLIYVSLCLNRQLFVLVLQQQQTMVYHFWCVVCLIGFLLEYKTQDKFPGAALHLVGCVISAILLSLFDALPLDIRGVETKIIVPGAIPVLLLIQAGLYFNWGDNPTFVIGALGHLSYTSSALASSAINNIIILCMLNAAYAFMYPSSLVMVKSRTETLELSEEEAQVLRAMDAVARQTAVKNRQEDVLTTIGRSIMIKIKGGGSAASSKSKVMAGG